MSTQSQLHPDNAILPWDPKRGGLVCPGCPDHAVTAENARFELVLEGIGLEGRDGQVDSVRVTRRAPGLGSGPFDVPALPRRAPMVAIIDFLERQTFDAHEAKRIKAILDARFTGATAHLWPIGPDVADRIAEDAYWDEGLLIRSPIDDGTSLTDYPMDVAWARDPERVQSRDGELIALHRGILYVDPWREGLVSYGWHGLSGPTLAPHPGGRGPR